MSDIEPDAPRTGAQASHCEDLCSKLEWRAACEAVLHMAYWSEIMEARARRNGRIAWSLRRKLAVVKQSRDDWKVSLQRTINENMVVLEKVVQERDAIGTALDDVAALFFDEAEWDYADVYRQAASLINELAAMTEERDALRREVAALVDRIAIFLCPPRQECVRVVDEVKCCECWAAWAKQQAGKGAHPDSLADMLPSHGAGHVPALSGEEIDRAVDAEYQAGKDVTP